MKTEYYQQLVWPLSVRLIHWIFALAVVVLLVTGWLLGSGMVLNPGLHEVLRNSLHIPAGQITAAALFGRLLLLALMPGVQGWRALLPTEANRVARGEMFRFYLAFGRRKSPGFYAHDPVWALVYPLLFLLLAVQVMTGFGITSQGLRQFSGWSIDGLASWHARVAVMVAWIAGLHVASVLLREIRGKGYEVSAMLHGHRVFERERGGLVDSQSGVNVHIPIEQLRGSNKNSDR